MAVNPRIQVLLSDGTTVELEARDAQGNLRVHLMVAGVTIYNIAPNGLIFDPDDWEFIPWNRIENVTSRVDV